QYVFQLMATDNKGATGVNKVIINISLPPVMTLTLQPSSNSNEVRVGIVGSQNISGPNYKNIVAAAWTVNGNITYIRGLFKFDLSSIPGSARILNARLSLYSDHTPTEGNLVDANYGNNNAMFLQRAISNWNVSTVTWQSQPAGDVATQMTIPHTAQSTLDLIDLDVTAQVKDMQQFGNYGFLLKLQDETIYTSRIFYSSTASDASKHPKLIVQYSN
ncbi:MAG TPA: DNRLRE domain-containing protein, partial [Flavisolibacter sp.]|nr:DNRLRE domain-containing protein [Flavisolibacter sp.]